MQEVFLHFIWQYQYFDKKKLLTSQGVSLQILDIGFANSHAGPDFLNARILLDNQEIQGDVEIDFNSSNWYSHKHYNNPQYENVVLHLVWENNEDLSIPTLVLKDRVDLKLLEKYQKLLADKQKIACQNSWDTVSPLKKLNMLERALVSRLEKKAGFVKELLDQNQKDWEETAYQLLAKNFGFKTNSDPFFELSQTIAVKILHKHRDFPYQIEALLFGQAGFLDEEVDMQDKYWHTLQQEYNFLAHKYQLSDYKLKRKAWKFLRLRPASFPTIRLAQFANIILNYPNFFSYCLYVENTKQFLKEFVIQASPYWQKHYDFGKTGAKKIAALGKDSLYNILINTVVPLLACYAKETNQPKYLDKAMELLEFIPAEKNNRIQVWEELNFKPKTAFESQALLEQYNEFCQKKQCLSCVVGLDILKNTN